MAEHRVYHSPLTEGPITLSPDESRHVVGSLRSRVGNSLELFDGCGHLAAAKIVRISKREVTVDAAEPVAFDYEQPRKLTLATALPKKHRQRFLVEKCTELGVYALWPTLCERSVVKPGPPLVEKWQRMAIEAAKQCERLWLPKLEPPRSFESVVEQQSQFDLTIVTDADQSLPPLGSVLSDATTILVLVGPEGGLTPDEIESATSRGALAARLGKHILRVETAAVCSTAVIGHQ
jgi:16S rRNA (uracil1498-N3)-methyltransferase